MKLLTTYKIWWTIDPSLVIPVMGIASSVELNDEELLVRFPSHPAIQSVRRGKRFKVHPRYKDFALLECQLNEESEGDLKAFFKYDIEIEAQSPNTSTAICFVAPPNPSDNITEKVDALKLVDSINPTDITAISIAERGLVKCSHDLSNKLIKCRLPVSFVGATEEIDESFETITSHLIGLFEDKNIYYMKHSSGELVVNESKSLYLRNWETWNRTLIQKPE